MLRGGKTREAKHLRTLFLLGVFDSLVKDFEDAI